MRAVATRLTQSIAICSIGLAAAVVPPAAAALAGPGNPGALPSCMDPGVSPLKCQSPGNAQINVSPHVVSPQVDALPQNPYEAGLIPCGGRRHH
jgi:hypothetical protein